MVKDQLEVAREEVDALREKYQHQGPCSFVAAKLLDTIATEVHRQKCSLIRRAGTDFQSVR